MNEENNLKKSGWIKIHRGWFDNHIFRQKTVCPRAAWIWLIEAACYAPMRVNVAGRIIQLERGQLSYSRTYLAKAWGWDESRVRRFINALKTDRMIDQATDQGQSIITICNYNKYQDEEKKPTGQTTGKRAAKEPATDRNNKNLRNKEVIMAVSEDFEKFYEAYPRKMKRGSAETAFAKAVASGIPAQKIIEAARAFAKARIGEDKKYTPYPASWLNAKCWDDEITQQATPAPNDDDRWKQRIDGWRTKSFWLNSWGPPPDDPKCECPAQLLKAA